MTNTILDRRKINSLLDEKFWVPSYQRGYRWSKKQVEALLNDIWEFKENKTTHENGEEKPFYCLQPIVVKDKYKNEVKHLEVIDGQQRLTTIFILLKYFNRTEYSQNPKKIFTLDYETRTECNNFFEQIDNEELAEKNIDYFHINQAYKTIDTWFCEKSIENDSIRHDFRSSLINDVQVIWYLVDDTLTINKDTSSSIDIFSRLNIGKIPLTNAELVKALFLQKSNFQSDKASLKQLQIASEWDTIEKSLQNDSFWYFIYNPKNPLQYDNRIEYIFDLMKGKTKDHEINYTFYKFYDDFSESKKEKNSPPDIDGLWLKIKKYFLSFEEWYNNKEFYHLIGFLIDCDFSIRILKEEASNRTKTSFRNYLNTKIRELVNVQLDELSYKDKPTKRVLLLFNIQTILATENTDIRFPFFRYKNGDWDIEHVRSQTDKQISGSNRIDWAIDILEYFTGKKGYSLPKEKSRHQEVIEVLEGKEKDFSIRLVKILNSDKIDDKRFDDLYKEITSHFKESDTPENIDSISNLALLDEATNRSYKNAMFPIKRKTIIENDKNGVFVPICTKNVFLKSYSKKLGEVMYWGKNDADDYLDAIEETLKEYLPIQSKNDEQ